mmetsp:Transcript_6420/g.23802  ORF Transcript_6420/g.23802 Transcript_6420/m.23802 type:complete len:212 (+) Transcript_6420:2947-3582(+)
MTYPASQTSGYRLPGPSRTSAAPRAWPPRASFHQIRAPLPSWAFPGRAALCTPFAAWPKHRQCPRTSRHRDPPARTQLRCHPPPLPPRGASRLHLPRHRRPARPRCRRSWGGPRAGRLASQAETSPCCVQGRRSPRKWCQVRPRHPPLRFDPRLHGAGLEWCSWWRVLRLPRSQARRARRSSAAATGTPAHPLRSLLHCYAPPQPSLRLVP